MAIARTQAVSANAASATLTSTSNDDLIIVFAYNNASTTIPTLPAGYTSLQTNSATGNAMRIGAKISAGGDTTTGSWTNATNVACEVYSGTSGAAVANRCLNTTNGAGNSATLTYTGFTMSGPGRNWIAGFGGAKAATAGMNGSTTNLGNRTNQTIINGLDSGGAEPSWASETLAVTGSGRWLTATVEINAPVTVNKQSFFMLF